MLFRELRIYKYMFTRKPSSHADQRKDGIRKRLKKMKNERGLKEKE